MTVCSLCGLRHTLMKIAADAAAPLCVCCDVVDWERGSCPHRKPADENVRPE